jgi:hypothetical protein
MVAIDNPGSEMADLMRRVRFLETQSGADGAGFGDGDHPGAGANSIQLGPSAAATDSGAVALGYLASAGYRAVAVGRSAWAMGDDSCAFGPYTSTDHMNSTSLGYAAFTTKDDQLTLGADHTEVWVPGRLNVARRTPSSSADTQGTVGDITSNDNYIYVKTNVGWKRAALSTF